MVSLVDLFPTLAELAGLPLPTAAAAAAVGREDSRGDGRGSEGWQAADGVSLVPLLQAPRCEACGNGDGQAVMKVAWDNPPGEASAWSIRDARWRYIRYVKTGGEELYDLKSDPHALRNLAAHAARADRACDVPMGCGRTAMAELKRALCDKVPGRHACFDVLD